ncbi:hypothetical protein HG530_007021 [Fusarium avenaceum]|nr:hypothetical protein HG530_007021 [Fusarium avenaceum]
MPAAKYDRMDAKFVPKGETPSEGPHKHRLKKKYGSDARQVVDLENGQLTYFVLKDFNDAQKTKEKLWHVLEKMKVFEHWEVHQIMVKEKEGKCEYLFGDPYPEQQQE